MKNKFCIISLCFILITSIRIHAQESAESLFIHDTRTTNESPAFYGKRQIRGDMKHASVIGLKVYGFGFTTNLSISPWHDASAGLIHQLNFNDGGIFYRNGDYSSSWNEWKKLLYSDSNGNIQIGDDTEEYIGRGKKLYFGTPEDNTDEIYFVRNNVSFNRTDLLLNIGDDDDDKFVIGKSIWNNPTEFTPRFIFKTNGCMGIGVSDPTFPLEVNGTIRAKEIKVESGWADFVFKKDYRLPTLKEVEKHINENGTLPSVPTEQEIKANGINLAKTNALLLQKIEELTLYIIQQDKRIETLESKMNNVSGNNK